MTSAATGRARRGPVLAATGIGGTALLGISLSTKPGSPRFYILTMGLAGTWAAGALSSGPLPLRRPGGRRDALLVAGSVLTGAAAFGVFYGAARLARHIPPLNRAIGTVLGYADRGAMPLVLLTASANASRARLRRCLRASRCPPFTCDGSVRHNRVGSCARLRQPIALRA